MNLASFKSQNLNKHWSASPTLNWGPTKNDLLSTLLHCLKRETHNTSQHNTTDATDYQQAVREKWREAPSWEGFSQITSYAPPAATLPLLSLPYPSPTKRFPLSRYPFPFHFLFNFQDLGKKKNNCLLTWFIVKITFFVYLFIVSQLQKRIPLASRNVQAAFPLKRDAVLSDTYSSV